MKKWIAALCFSLSAALTLSAGAANADMQSLIDVMCAPSGIAAVNDGGFLVTDTYNKVIHLVRDGKSTVYAGAKTQADLYGEPIGGYNDASLKRSYFSEPWDIVPFMNGWAVSDASNNAIRLIRSGKVQTVNAKIAGQRNAVKFNHPTGLASDENGNLYVADTHNNLIRQITPEGVASTFISGLSEPTALFWKNDALYAAETGKHRIVKIKDGKSVLVAGTGTEGFADGAAGQASFSSPQGITVDGNGVVYVSDTGNSAVRKIANGYVTTLAAQDRGEMSFGLAAPTGILLRENVLYVCDPFSRKIFSFTL